MKIIRIFLSCSALFFLHSLLVQAQQPWQTLQMPTHDQALRLFADPPSEYGPDIYYELDGTRVERIGQDLDRIRALGFRAVTFQAGRGMPVAYLSDGYFALVKQLVQQAKQRDLRVWIVDDAGYPSGFAGGRFSSDAPSLRMQALSITNQIDLTSGMEFEDVVAPGFVSAVAYNLDSGEMRPLKAVAQHIRFTPPAGRWRVVIADHVYRTSLTRSVTNSTGAKDDTQSLENYLDAAATRKYLEFVHEQYRKAIGEEFGKTVLGFRGDEPDFSFFGLPYAPDVFAEFKKQRGYDLQPMAAALLLPQLTPEVQRMAADYADVWSAMFRDNFFALQAAWCRAHGLEYQVHLNHEDDLPRLAVTEGDFLRNLTAVQLPGVDTIWHQIWPGIAPDFPKLASSAAHLGGHPRAFTESFAAYVPAPHLEQARFILNEQMVRGINLVEVMGALSGAHAAPFMTDPDLPELMTRVRRTTALLSQGQPTAQVGLYVPTRNFWLQNNAANVRLLALAHKLLAAQYDFDFIDDDSLRNNVTSNAGGLRTASGNLLRTVLVPQGSLLTTGALHKLEALLQAGGHVVFFGSLPDKAVGNTLLTLDPAPTLHGATVETQAELTARVRQVLPAADLQVLPAAEGLRYVHRHLADAEVYFVFNELPQEVHGQLQLRGSQQVEEWLPENGQDRVLASKPAENGMLSVALNLAGYETLLLVTGRSNIQ